MEEIKNKFELRKLKSSDLFKIVNIISKIGLKKIKDCIFEENNSKTIKDLKKSINEENKDKIANEIGSHIMISVGIIILENLENIEKDLYVFAGSICGKEPKEIEELNPNDFLELLISISKMDDFKDFFSQALKLVGLV